MREFQVKKNKIDNLVLENLKQGILFPPQKKTTNLLVNFPYKYLKMFKGLRSTTIALNGFRNKAMFSTVA